MSANQDLILNLTEVLISPRNTVLAGQSGVVWSASVRLSAHSPLPSPIGRFLRHCLPPSDIKAFRFGQLLGAPFSLTDGMLPNSLIAQ